MYYFAFDELPDCVFENLILDGAYLPEANFSRKALSNTSLRSATLDNVDFTEADLTGCDFTNVDFEKTKSIYSMRFSVDEKERRSFLYALYSDGKLRKWSLNNTRPVGTQSIELKSACSLGDSSYGLMLFQKNRISFIGKHGEKLEIIGGVHLSKMSGFFICDIKDGNVLIGNDKQRISLYSMKNKEKPFVIEDYQLEEGANAIINNNSHVLVYYDALGPRILSATENGTTETPFGAYLDRKSLGSIAATAVPQNFNNERQFRICVAYKGTKNGNLTLYGLDGSSGILTKISSYPCGRNIHLIQFAHPSLIAYTGQDGVIHVLKLEGFELTPDSELKLAITCSGAKIEGVQSRKQYDILKAHIGIEKD